MSRTACQEHAYTSWQANLSISFAYGFSFKKPVYFGDTIASVWTFTDIDPKGRARAEVDFRNQGTAFVISATCKGISPNVDERAEMTLMRLSIQDAFLGRSAIQSLIMDCLGTPKRLASLSSN
jgi:hypothetical protein